MVLSGIRTKAYDVVVAMVVAGTPASSVASAALCSRGFLGIWQAMRRARSSFPLRILTTASSSEDLISE